MLNMDVLFRDTTLLQDASEVGSHNAAVECYDGFCEVPERVLLFKFGESRAF